MGEVDLNVHEDTRVWRCSNNKYCQNWCNCMMMIISWCHILPSAFGHLNGAYSSSTQWCFPFVTINKDVAAWNQLGQEFLDTCAVWCLCQVSQKSHDRGPHWSCEVSQAVEKKNHMDHLFCLCTCLTFFIKELTWRLFFGDCLNLLPKAALVSLCPGTEAN